MLQMKNAVGATLPDHSCYRYMYTLRTYLRIPHEPRCSVYGSRSRREAQGIAIAITKPINAECGPLARNPETGSSYRLAGDWQLIIIHGMKSPRAKQWMLFLILCFLIRVGGAAVWDTDKEREIADKLVTQLEYGELIWLQTDTDKSSKFPVIYTLPVYNNQHRAVILLHGMSAHMDWPVVISPLRGLFRDKLWASLSIQLPVIADGESPAEYSKTMDEASSRINRAIRYLQDQGYSTVVLIGYGFGATTAAYFLAGRRLHDIHAFIGISMLARKYLAPHVNLLEYLEKFCCPTLDIYGSNDLPVIVRSADDRRLSSRKNGTCEFSQIAIEGADHFYTGQEQALFDSIITWLDDLDSGLNGFTDYQAIQDDPALKY